MREDKQKICDLLAEALRATHNAADLISIEYMFNEDSTESVKVLFASGGVRRINVTMDSGTAMIRDIMAGLGC